MRINRLLPLLVLPFALVACDDNTFEPGAAGTMSIMLTDAPGDFENAIVTIDRIELLGDGVGAQDRIVLLDDPVTVDLLDLQNEVMVLVGETPVPGGTYSELRLVISDGLISVEQDDGSLLVYASSDAFATSQGFDADGDLQMPSFAQSGLKIKLPAGEAVVEGDDNAVLIDFNVAGSFGHQAGNSGKWVLHPVLHATGFTTTGAIRLQVLVPDSVTLPTIATTQVTMAMLGGLLDKNGEPISVLFSDDDGDETWEALFRFLPPGSYSVGFALPDSLVVTTNPVLPVDLTVTAGQTTTQQVTITSAAKQ
ncbi:MAG TPA: DUF4382 domain-containing protein [Longimicrobiales bacterium]